MKIYAKKALTLIFLLAIVLVEIPQTVNAEDEYSYEIVVEPSPVAIGDEVTLTVRLTTYDETKAGIRGFQIDITNVGETLQNSTVTSLVTDSENVLSNHAAYQPARDLVRHLYMKLTGTLDRSQTELLQVKIPISDSFTEAGTISLPFRLLIQTDAEENNQLTYNSTINIDYAPASEIPEEPMTDVEITWGEMNYTYTDGKWNPITHSYKDGGWTDNNSGYVTVKNTGDSDVQTSFTYTTERTDIIGSFSDGENNVITTIPLEKGEEKTVYLILSGQPVDYLGENVPIGTVNVILEGKD